MKAILVLILNCLLVGLVYLVLITPSFELVEPPESASSEEDVDLKTEEESPVISEGLPFFSTDVDFTDHKSVSPQTKEFFDNYATLCEGSIKRYENLFHTVENYVQRYVSLFLITTNLLNYDTENSNDDMIIINLEISISKEDLTYLQNYSKDTKNSFYPRNFDKLNEIFSKIARLKQKSYAEKSMSFFKSFFANFNIFSEFNSHKLYFFFPLVIIFLATFIIFFLFYRISFFIFIGTIINSMIIWEGLQLYWKKIKELDIELYVNMLKLKNVPEECDPKNQRWYHNVINFFMEDKCLQYYMSINKSASEEVFLFQCIVDKYCDYFVRVPVRILCSSVKDFTGEISAIWPWPVRWIFQIPLLLLVTVCALFFVLILCGKRLRLSFFGAAVEIGDAKTNTVIENSDSNKATPKAVRVVRKLKPWTISRFPERHEINTIKRRMPYLKHSKSVPDITAESQLTYI